MSHVDEGALHAYLDGALDAYPDGEARRIRAHLDHCGMCLARLEEERSVRERAAAVLAAADAPVVMPPLEELRRLARSGDAGRSVRVRRRYRVGWAASVVLALGTGWALRSTLPPTSTEHGNAPEALASPSEPSATEGPTAAPDARVADATTVQPHAQSAVAAPPGRTSSVAERRSGLTEPGAALAGGAGPVDRAVPASGTARAEEKSGVAAGVSPEVVVADEALPPRELFAAADPASGAGPPAPSDSAALRVERDALRPDRVASAVAEAPAAPSAETQAAVASVPVPSSEAGAERSDVAAPEQEAGRSALELRVSAASPRMGFGSTGVGVAGDSGDPVPLRSGADPGSLVVPGLEVVSIVWLQEGVTPAGVRVLQRLERDDVLELIHLPEGIEPDSVEPPGPGVTQLMVPRENGWLLLRAPLDEAALTELLRRLEAAP